jgi:membrane protein DedA with SNARE-associated domain
MHGIAALLVTFFISPAIVQQHDVASENDWRTYGYIALGAIILIVIVVVLIRKQHRKFNE